MPQREFWTTAHPVEVRWSYRVDPVDPQIDGYITVSVYDQAGKLMEHATGSVPWELTHEAVVSVLQESWEGFLFGERHAAPRALRLCLTRYRRHAARRKLQGILGL